MSETPISIADELAQGPISHAARPIQRRPEKDIFLPLVVVQAEPVHRFEDRVDRGLRAALAVGVLDAQDELAAAAARLQPAVQRGARAADVQVAGGAGGETGAAGRGLGHAPILPA